VSCNAEYDVTSPATIFDMRCQATNQIEPAKKLTSVLAWGKVPPIHLGEMDRRVSPSGNERRFSTDVRAACTSLFAQHVRASINPEEYAS
jgi:hypothetical protein